MHRDQYDMVKNCAASKEARMVCKMWFELESDDKGIACYFKACLLAQGLFRKEGIDYSEMIVLIITFEVFLLLVGMFVSKGWQVHHTHICTAYLNADTDEKLYASRNDFVYESQKRLLEL